MSNLLIKTITCVTHLLLLTPLVIAPWFVYPFVAPKAIFFWVISEIIFALWICLAILNKKYRFKESVLFYSVVGFVLVSFISSLKGVNLTLSLFSTFERMTGLITLTHAAALFIALSSIFTTIKKWRQFARTAVFVGFLAAIVFFLDDYLGEYLPQSRRGSTLGNSSFFGSYIIFPIFFALYFFLRDRGLSRIFAFIQGLVIFFALYFSHATGAFYSFWIGIIFVMISYLFFNNIFDLNFFSRMPFRQRVKPSDIPKERVFGLASLVQALALKPSWVVAILVVLITVSLSSFIAYGTLTQNEKILNFLPAKLHQSRIGARLVVWSTSWQAIKERPVLGWGFENFQTAYVENYNPCMPIPEECGGEIWFDKAHNAVVDTLVASGFAGLLAYFSIFGTATFLIWRKGYNVSAPMSRKKWLLPAILTALLAAYFIQNLFVFDMPTTYLMFFFVLAMVGGITTKKLGGDYATAIPARAGIDRLIAKGRLPRIQGLSSILADAIFNKSFNLKSLIVCLFTLAVLVSGLYFFGYRSLLSAHLVWESMHTTVPNIENRLKLYTASLKATPLGAIQTRQSFTNNAILWLEQEVNFPGETLKIIEREAEKMAKENPYDLRSNLVLGNFYNAMTKYFILKFKDRDTAQIYLDKARLSLEKAFELSPTNHQVYLSLSQNFIFRKDYKTAEKILQEAIDLEPRYGDSHYNLGDLYVIIKNFDKAAVKFDDALLSGYRVDTVGKASQIAQAYYEIGQYEKAAKWYEYVVVKKPKDPDAHWTLAVIYRELNEFDKAKFQAEIVLKIDKKYAGAVKEFLKTLKKID